MARAFLRLADLEADADAQVILADIGPAHRVGMLHRMAVVGGLFEPARLCVPVHASPARHAKQAGISGNRPVDVGDNDADVGDAGELVDEVEAGRALDRVGQVPLLVRFRWLPGVGFGDGCGARA